MTRVVTNYQTGVKYSFRPHGLKSKFLIAAASFVTALGSALMFGGPADAAPLAVATVQTGTVTAAPDDDYAGPNTPWARDTLNITTTVYVDNTVHQAVTGTFLAVNGATGTISGYLDYSVTGTLLTDFSGVPTTVDLSGDLGKASPSKIATWATRYFTSGATVGAVTGWQYTYTGCNGAVITEPPGQAYSSYSSTFAKCVSIPGPTVTVTVQVPGPTTVVTHDQFITVQSTPTTTPSATPSASPSPSASPTPGPVATTPNRSAAPTMVPVSNNSSPDYLLWLAIALAILGGFILLALLAARIFRRRGQYQGAHSSSAQTQMLPVVGDNYDISDYNPGGGYDPKLGGYPGANWALHSQDLPPADNSATVEFPPASEVEPPADSDTRPLPPA